jgi:hypothetical protein
MQYKNRTFCPENTSVLVAGRLERAQKQLLRTEYERLIINNKYNKNNKNNKINNLQCQSIINHAMQNGPKMMPALGLRQVDSGENTRMLGDFNAQSTATGQQGLTGHHTTLGFMAHDVQLTKTQLFCRPNYLFAPQPAILHGEEWDESDIYEFQQIILINYLDKIAAVILEPISNVLAVDTFIRSRVGPHVGGFFY